MGPQELQITPSASDPGSTLGLSQPQFLCVYNGILERTSKFTASVPFLPGKDCPEKQQEVTGTTQFDT